MVEHRREGPPFLEIAAVAVAEAEMGGSTDAVADYILGWLYRAGRVDPAGMAGVIAAIQESSDRATDPAGMRARLHALEAAQMLSALVMPTDPVQVCGPESTLLALATPWGGAVIAACS